jgi:hypothetical protein
MRIGFTSVGAGLIASVVAHLMLLVVVAVPYQRQTVHGETVTVDLVSPEEAGSAFNDQPAPPEQQPDWSKLQFKQSAQQTPPTLPTPGQTPQQQPSAQSQQASRQPQSSQPPPAQSTQRPRPQQSLPQQPQQPPQPPRDEQATSPQPSETAAPEAQAEDPAEQGMRLAALLGLPPPGESKDYDIKDQDKADLAATEMAAFKTQLKKCWSLPPGVSENQTLNVIVRVELRPDGKLVRDPQLIQGPASELGFALSQKALQALKQCQPYTMFPADKYKEWRALDLNFSPDLMAGG